MMVYRVQEDAVLISFSSHSTVYIRNSNHNFFTRFQTPIGHIVSHDILLGRWRLALDLFGRVFCDDVGAEPGSIISELGGFPVKEGRFRREMEKLRTNQQRDLTLDVWADMTVQFLSLNLYFYMRSGLRNKAQDMKFYKESILHLNAQLPSL